MSAEFLVSLIAFALIIMAWAVLPIRPSLSISEREEPQHLASRTEERRLLREEEALA